MSQIATPPPPLMTSETHRRALSFKTMSPSLLIIFGILVLTVFASISLCLLLRHLNSRCLRRLATPSSASATESRRISTRRVNPEAPPSLPLFTYSSINRRSSTTIPADCAVCLSKFEPDDELRLLPLCCHGFHAMCIDAWLQSHQTCPLCRAPIFASDAEVMTLVTNVSAAATNGGSFRLEIGNVSQRSQTASHQHSNSDGNLRSYSIGSFEYVVDDESSEVRLSNAHKDEIILVIAEPEPPHPPQSNLAAEAGSGRSSWLKEYIDRISSSLSSRDISFRSSGRFFTGSSRRSDVSLSGDWGVEANRLGDEISEMFRWLSGM